MSPARLLKRGRTWLQIRVARSRCAYYRRRYGATIGEGCRISMKAWIDPSGADRLTIGAWTILTPAVRVLTGDPAGGAVRPTRIGSRCFIGARTIVMAGVTIGDHCVIGAGSVVREDIPAGSIAAGNPARVFQSGITTLEYGAMPRPAA